MEESRKNKRKVKNCAKEKKEEKVTLSYENEYSLYQKEISLKIEEFKLARANWVASKKEEEIIKTNSKEGLNESGAYRGRFNSLKKIGLSTARLREHYQTVKPLRYFTLKPKVSDTDASKSRQEKQWNQPLIEQDSFEEDTMLRENKQQIWDEKETEIKELVDKALGGKVAEKKKKKRKGPSKKAIENLKASKHADRVLETCKCNDGKEVTVVIKGFCLCDKGNLKTFKLNKINDDIKKLEKFKPGLKKEEIEPHLVDSIEFHKKQIEHKSAMVKEEEEEKEENQQDGIQRSKSARSVSFGPPNIIRGIDSKWKSEKNEEKRDQEEEGGKERFEEEQKKMEEEETEEEEIRKKQEELKIEQEDMRKKMEEEKKQQEEIRKKQEELKIEQENMRKNREEEEKQQEEMRKKQVELRKEQEDLRKNREEEEKQQEEMRKERKRERRKEKEEKMVQQEERSVEKNEAESKKQEEKNEKLQNSTDGIASVITIFRNRSPNKSSMALTEEQFEKMKTISE